MVLIASHFVDSIKNTDNFVNQRRLTHLSKPLSKTIKTVMRVCDYLFEKYYSLFLTGSLAICLRAGSLKEYRVLGDKSDVDLWIIINNSPYKSLKSSSLKNKIIKGFSRLIQFDIVCIPFKSNNLNLSLKMMTGETAKEILNFKKIKLAVLRCNSLKITKKENVFYGVKKVHHIPIIEKKLKNHEFMWRWPTNPFIGKDFVLTDIHSCFLVGGFLVDGLGLIKIRNLFLSKFFHYFQSYKNISNNNQANIFRYFYNKFPLSTKKIFGKEKGADSFIENAPRIL